MASLDLRVRSTPLAESKLPRVAQLTQRTNQFNLTTVRRTEAEIQSLKGTTSTRSRSATALATTASSAWSICNRSGTSSHVDTFLLSCRVLGRGVEHRVAAFLGQTAASRGLSHVVFPYERTKKNSPARDFLASLSIGEQTPRENWVRFAVPAAELAELRWTPPPSGRSQRRARRVSATSPCVAGRGLRLHRERSRVAGKRSCRRSARLITQPQSGGIDDGNRGTTGAHLGRVAGTTRSLVLGTTSSTWAATRCSPCCCCFAFGRASASSFDR